MSVPIPHLASRLVSLIAFTVVGALIFGSGIATGLIGRSLLGAGIVLLGVFAYLQPLVYDVPVRTLFSASQALSIGSQRVRAAVSMAALALLAASLVLTLLRI